MVGHIATIFACCVATLTYSNEAQAQQFGKWFVGPLDNNEGVFAGTVNDSHGLLGEYCYTKDGNCLWLIKTEVDCNESQRYPILVNADSGSSSMELLCVKVEGKPRYAFTEFATIDRIAKNSLSIGFAFPMASGYFHVSRFSLEGAAKALPYMRDIATKIAEPTEKKGTKDVRL